MKNKFFHIIYLMKVFLSLAIVFCVFALIIGGFFIYDSVMYPLKYETYIKEVGEEFNVSPNLIASVINSESGFNEKALSNKGAVGLMQLLPSTASWLYEKLVKLGKLEKQDNIENYLFDGAKLNGKLFDAKLNIYLGSYYLAYLSEKFSERRTMLCAYNAGEGKVNEWLESFSTDGKSLSKIPYKETEKYVNKIENNLKIYSKKL